MEHSDSKSKYTEEDIIRVLEFLVDNIFVVFAGKVFQQIIGISMCTNCAPLLADIFLYSYEAEFTQFVLSTGRTRLASQFSSVIDTSMTYCPLITPTLKIITVGCIPEFEINDNTESYTSAFYFDLLLSIGTDGQLHTPLYDKCDDFIFQIANFPFLSINIPSSPAYGVFISQII